VNDALVYADDLVVNADPGLPQGGFGFAWRLGAAPGSDQITSELPVVPPGA
jgi:hypothetical protein